MLLQGSPIKLAYTVGHRQSHFELSVDIGVGVSVSVGVGVGVDLDVGVDVGVVVGVDVGVSVGVGVGRSNQAKVCFGFSFRNKNKNKSSFSSDTEKWRKKFRERKLSGKKTKPEFFASRLFKMLSWFFISVFSFFILEKIGHKNYVTVLF